MGKHFGFLNGYGPRLAAAMAVVLLTSVHEAQAQLRIVTYNTSTGHTTGVKTARTGMDVVLQSIGEESKNGISRPIDVLLLQEQYSVAVSVQSFVDVLNGIYGTPGNPTPYAGSEIDGFTSEPSGDGGRPGMVWNTSTVDLTYETAFGTVSGSAQPRSTLFYLIHPLGYDSTADFVAYNSHYKAGTTTTDKNRRNIEATSIRTDMFNGSDNLGPGVHVLYVGDYNIQSSSEQSYQTLLAAGEGQAFDPLNSPGTWNNNSSFAAIHTQAPCLSGCSSDLTQGGMDDRFDFQLMTSEFLDGEGLSYIGPNVPGMSGVEESYHAFGNNGTTYNDDINDVSNTYDFGPGMTYTKAQILNNLRVVSDHLPVVADYQLPAKLSVLADSVPATLNQGDTFDLDVTVWNSAPVDVAIGADELDYSLTTVGDLSGEFLSQMDLALGAMNMHAVGFDTSTPGMKSGTITVSSSSQAVGSGTGVVGGVWTLNVMYEVLAAAGLAGDYNENDVIDAADYTAWRDAMTAGSGTLANDPTPGTVDESDFIYWRDHFGDVLGSGAGSGAAAVPEPSTWLMLLLGVCLTRLMGGKLGAWTRRS